MRIRTLLPLAAVLLAACETDPASPELQATVAGLFQEGRALQVGEVLTLTAGEAQALFLQGGENGAEYLYVPFNASASATARLAVEVRGGNVAPPTRIAGTARAPAPSRAPWLDPAGVPEPDDDFHEALREREIRELGPRVRATGGALSSRSAAPGETALLPANPGVGDILEINVNPNQACTNPEIHQGRVVAVTDRAVVVEDLANPAGGFTQEEFRHVGETFDTLIYPVDVLHFGEPVYPAYIAPQERTVIFYTREVNELTPAGSGSYVGGFFFGRDLFPHVTTAGFEGCPASNRAPIMYLLAPDPTGALGNVRTKDFVLRVTLSTVAHEFQHLINQARRFFAVPGAEPFEEVWLNEGLSHVAEGLMFFAITPFEPGDNVGIEEVRSAEHVRRAFNTYMVNNLGRYITYLENPDTTSLIGQDELPTRGASWAFLRYAADQDPGPDAPFFRSLVDGPKTGVENLADVLAVDPILRMQTWTVSVFTDDALPGVPLPSVYQQPSWDFRSILGAVLPEFPLAVRTLTETERSLVLRPGGAAFFRFAVRPGEQATIVTTSGGAVPDERLRVSIARLR